MWNIIQLLHLNEINMRFYGAFLKVWNFMKILNLKKNEILINFWNFQTLILNLIIIFFIFFYFEIFWKFWNFMKFSNILISKKQFLCNNKRLLHDIFQIGPRISPRLPYQARQRSWSADMGRGLIPGTIWKISWYIILNWNCMKRWHCS